MILYKLCWYSGLEQTLPALLMFFYYMVAMNLSLGVFNLLPVPPFDGSRIALLFLPQRLYFKAMKYERYIMLTVLALVFLGLLDIPLSWLVNGMWRLMLQLTGFVELLWGIDFLPEILTFKIEDFEGPLDLLLYLVGKNKMNLYDINIMALIEQYTAAIREMQQDRMEVSSEFIDMAAHLVQMKSALLLPRSPEAERMKAELTGRLIEYSACRRLPPSWAAVPGIYTPQRASRCHLSALPSIPAAMTRTGWCRPGST